MRVEDGERVLHQRHDAHGRRDRFAFEPVRLAAPVPALVELAQRIDDGAAESEPFREPLRDLAMAGERVVRDAFGDTESARDAQHGVQRAGAFIRCTDVAREDSQDVGNLARVDQRDVPPQRELVAEQRREHVRLRVTADVAQQRLIVDLGELRVVEPERFAQPYGQHARP